MSSTTPSNHWAVAHPPDLPSAPVPLVRQLPTWVTILVFCLFAGLIAETFVTDSTPPVDILRLPFSVPYNVVLYGTFDLLAREMLVRRRAGLASVLLLGAAYGFINEGVVAGTWYAAHPPGYAFIGQIDWLWVLSLTLFHTVFSVITPIAFIEILFPSVRGRPLLRRWGMVSCVVLFLGCVVVALVFVPLPLFLLPYRLTVLAVAVVFVVVALALPAGHAPAGDSLLSPLRTPSMHAATPTGGLPGVWHLRLAGFLAVATYFFLSSVFPSLVATLLRAWPSGLVLAQGVDGIVLLAFGALMIGWGWTWSRRAGWSPRQNLALLLGGVTFTTPLLNLTEAPLGESFSTLPFYVLLLALTLRWRYRAPAPEATA